MTEGKYNGDYVNAAEIKAQLAKAQYDLDQTVILAPADGYVTNLQLQKGTSIAILAGNPMLTFVPESEKYVIASIAENTLRYVEPGQEVELAMRYYPGQILRGKVDQVISITGEGQLKPTATLPKAADIKTGGRFAVKIKLDKEFADRDLPVGTGGTVAIYTDVGKPTHIIRKVMMRMQTWMNYVF